jgi:hypothetical protein
MSQYVVVFTVLNLFFVMGPLTRLRCEVLDFVVSSRHLRHRQQDQGRRSIVSS